MKSGVYTITNTIDGKIYVGYSKNIKKRFSSHLSYLRRNKHPNAHLQYACNKYGLECLLFEVLEYHKEEEMASFENFWVNMLMTNDSKYGYNISPTNPYGYCSSHSQQTRDKLRLANIGRCAGPNNYFFGKKGELSPCFGLKKTKEQKAAISARMTGEGNPMFGKNFTEDHRNKMSESRRLGKHFKAKRVVCQKTGQEWDCAHSAAIYFNIPYSTMRSMLNGFRKNKTNLAYAA